jgi:hypothetical protein
MRLRASRLGRDDHRRWCGGHVQRRETGWRRRATRRAWCLCRRSRWRLRCALRQRRRSRNCGRVARVATDMFVLEAIRQQPIARQRQLGCCGGTLAADVLRQHRPGPGDAAPRFSFEKAACIRVGIVGADGGQGPVRHRRPLRVGSTHGDKHARDQNRASKHMSRHRFSLQPSPGLCPTHAKACKHGSRLTRQRSAPARRRGSPSRTRARRRAGGTNATSARGGRLRALQPRTR